MTAQDPFDVAVIIPTLLRPELVRAVESVFRQDIKGRVQILIGIDVALGGASGLQALQALQARTPANMHITVLDPGYSTSERHGGLYSNRFSGAMRTILSYLATGF